jgi:hypothetical protein
VCSSDLAADIIEKSLQKRVRGDSYGIRLSLLRLNFNHYGGIGPADGTQMSPFEIRFDRKTEKAALTRTLPDHKARICHGSIIRTNRSQAKLNAIAFFIPLV